MSDPQSEVPPHEFTAPLTVCVDVRNPHAYLCLQPVRELCAKLGVDVDWLPFPSAPLKAPPPATSGDDRGARHRRFRADYQARELERYAAAQGLTLADIYRAPDSTLASLALLWTRRTSPGQLDSLLVRLFRGYWEGSLDIEDQGAIERLQSELGNDAPAFARYAVTEGPGELSVLRERLVAAGVFTVPSLVVQNEVFVGRAHLPMVRWLLTDRVGPPPV